MPVATDAITPVLQRAFAHLTNGSTTLTADEEAKLAAAISQVATALLNGNFTELLYVVAELGGVPAVAASAIDRVCHGRVLQGAKALVPVATEAITPVLQHAFASVANGTNTLTSDEDARLAGALSQVALGLIDGDFRALVDAMTHVAGIPNGFGEAFVSLVNGNFMHAAEKLIMLTWPLALNATGYHIDVSEVARINSLARANDVAGVVMAVLARSEEIPRFVLEALNKTLTGKQCESVLNEASP